MCRSIHCGDPLDMLFACSPVSMLSLSSCLPDVPSLLRYDSWDGLQLPHEPELGKQKKMDGWVDEPHEKQGLLWRQLS